MRKFKDIKHDLKINNPDTFFALDIMGKLMIQRDRLGITQRQLSKLSGVAQKTISRLENGIDFPSIETLSKLAIALKMEIIVVDENYNDDE